MDVDLGDVATSLKCWNLWQSLFTGTFCRLDIHFIQWCPGNFLDTKCFVKSLARYFIVEDAVVFYNLTIMKP